MTNFETVGELIDYLEKLGRNRLLILDDDGNTDNVTSSDVRLWDENSKDSPVAIFVRR